MSQERGRCSRIRLGEWLLDALGDDFVLLACGWHGPAPAGARLVPVEGVAADRLGLVEGAAVLLRPDPYVAARWKVADAAAVEAALIRAKGSEAWLN
jgi:3-(3-hydroxy-phenyl)propionate hydroxylase